MAAPACPSSSTLVATTSTRSALLTKSNCSTNTLNLTKHSLGDGSLTLNAQRLGIASYVHAVNFPAAVVYESIQQSGWSTPPCCM